MVILFSVFDKNGKRSSRSLRETMVFAILVGGSIVFESVFASRVYAVPVLSSVCVTSLGLSFWIKAKLRMKEGRDSKSYLFFGSTLMMLNLGCRPQFMVACFLAFPLFWREIIKTRELFSIDSVSETLCALLPIPLVSRGPDFWRLLYSRAHLDPRLGPSLYEAEAWGRVFVGFRCFIFVPCGVHSPCEL